MNPSFIDHSHRILPSFIPSKTSAFAGAGDALGLRGGYSSASIVNDRRETETRFKPVRTSARPLKSITFTRVATSSHDIGKSEKSVIQADR